MVSTIDSSIKSSRTNSLKSSIREAIKNDVFPNNLWLQEFFTHLSGCPYLSQEPMLYLNPVHYIIMYGAAFILGISITCFALNEPVWNPLVLLGWILTTGGTSGFQLSLVHNAAHLQVYRNKKADTWLARILEIIILMPDGDTYIKGHRKHHNRRTHQTEEDNRPLAKLNIRQYQLK